jgi:hypothetical protein
MALADEADIKLVDDFVRRIEEIAQEAVTGQSKYSASELLELAKFRIASKGPRVSSHKVNPFNIFQQEMKSAENLELRRPGPGAAGTNKGRPAFTGAYQQDLAEKYNAHKAEFQQKAKERNDAPPNKVEKGSDLKAYRKLVKKAAAFSEELSNHDAHHVMMIVPGSALPAFKPLSFNSDGYGYAFRQRMEKRESSLLNFEVMCRGGDILADVLKPAQAEVLKRDDLRVVVRDMIVAHISKSSASPPSQMLTMVRR